jgi:hypothetical protein
MSGVEDMIYAAEQSLGLGEPNYIQDWYHARNGSDFAGNFAWCDASITYWAWHSGNQDAVTFGGDYALTTAHAAKFRQETRWHVDIAGIQRGDIVFFDWGGSDVKRNIDHVGVVTGADAAGIYTIEGNYDDVCARHVRHSDWIAGYGRPAYTGSSQGARTGFVTYPGASFFVMGRRSPVIAAMHDRLVAEDCDGYETQVDKDLWGTGDVRSYAMWQRKCGFTGDDADGIPGRQTWDLLRVPRT